MLKRALVCIMLVVAAAMAWKKLDDVHSPARVETGARITWGNGLVWGMFPTTDSDETYVEYYSPGANPPQWGVLEQSMESAWLGHTSLTFQWVERPVLHGIGADIDGDAKLYSYDVYADDWDDYDIDENEEFSLGSGTCIAFVPNSSWNVWSYAMPGWIYCLPGGDTSLWRYRIPDDSIPDISLFGYYPGPNAVIADQTPTFKWSPSTPPTQYWLQVSTNPFFLGNVIDTMLSTPAFEPDGKLANNTYYWRTATWTGGGWNWGANSHSFLLQGGWERRKGIPMSVGTGAAMAYDGDALGYPALLALRGGGHKGFYAYRIDQDTWFALGDAPVEVHGGTSLTTHDPTGEWALHPMAAFGGSDTSDCPYHYHPDDSVHWVPFDTTDTSPDFCSRFPEHLGSDASMVAGTDAMDYLIAGDNHFYRLEPPPESRGGGQTGVTLSAKEKALVVTGRDGIKVEYQLPASSHVRATVHDAAGRQVGYLDVGEQNAGVHRLSWSRDQQGRKLTAGAYFVLLSAGSDQYRLKAVVK